MVITQQWVDVDLNLLLLQMEQRNKSKLIRIEDLLMYVEKDELGPQTAPFDPEQYENTKNFICSEGNTLQDLQVQHELKHIETDNTFAEGVIELAWRKFGLNKQKNELTDSECEQIHLEASQYHEKQQVNASHLICQNLMGVQYLTYDNVFFFFFLKVLFLNGIIMSVGYVLPAMYWFGQGDRYLTKNLFGCSDSYCQFIDQFSMYNEANPGSNFVKLEWIGLAVIGVLQITFYLAWKYNKEIRQILRYEERCCECSMLIRGLPEGSYNEEDILSFCERKLQAQTINAKNTNFSEERMIGNIQSNVPSRKDIQLITIQREQRRNGEAYHFEDTRFKKYPDRLKNPFKIQSIQIVYDCSEAKQIIQSISQISKDLWDLLQQGQYQSSKVYFVIDHQKYLQKKKEVIGLYQRLAQWRQKFLNGAQFRKAKALGSAFLHFDNRADRDRCLDFLKQFYQTTWTISWGNFGPCEKLQNKTNQGNIRGQQSIRLEDYKLKVGLAPEPENIIWQKVEHTYDEWLGKYAGCRVVMVLVPLIHVASIVGLQILKTYLLEGQSSAKTILSYVVTLLIVIVNQLLWVFLEMAVQGQEQRLLTSYEVYKNYAGFAGTALSIIIAPIAVNYWFKDTYFGTQAIVGSAFDYQLTTLVTIPILMTVGPDQILKSLFLKVQCLRNWLIRRKYRAEQGYRLQDIYSFYGNPEFDISSTYAFLMSNFLHAAFFCMLVPIIIPMYTAQVVLLYWSSKVRILKFCKFPKLIRRWLMGIVFANLLVSPLFFAGGCLLHEHAFGQMVAPLDHTPIALYLFFAWWLIFTVASVNIDKCLEKKNLFECFYPEDSFKNLESWQNLRNKPYPSKSSSYFVGNNVLQALGFEKAILGTVRNRKAEVLLQNFCRGQANGRAELEFEYDRTQ